MFKSVSNKVDFSALEAEVLRFWEEKDIFIRSVAERPEDKLFVLYEGPPTANASPGIHHVLARVFKDVIPRYKTMKGYRAPRKGGWDTHGLPVELEVEKELGLKSKREIETYGVEHFNQRCRESVMRYVREWEDLTRRIAFWVDMEQPYRTYDNDYIESGWWIIKQLWDKGLVYQGYKVTPHCPRCGTSLSSHEVALGYEEVDDPSIYVRFRLRSDLQYLGDREDREGLKKLGWDVQGARWQAQRPSLLVWTTTPWTLTANMAVAIAQDETYVLVEAEGPEGVVERLILAKARAEAVLGNKLRRVVAELSGRELAYKYYEPIHQFAMPPNGFYRALPADFVSMDEGTGIVHIAPAYGEEDMELGRRNDLPVTHTVNQDGTLKEFVEPFRGKFVKEADPLILEDLKRRGLLYRQGTVHHTYPFCWRCDSPLLYYAKSSWYIRTTAAKDRLVGRNQEVNWYPEHIKEGRFGDWLRNNVDWAISRERYWGTPLPIWKCQGCGKEVCIGSIEELRQMAHNNEMAKAGYSLEECLKDLHRPNVDNIILKCPGQPGSTHNPDTMRRVPEVMDCWFDSGAMPFAQWHYPFQNREEFQRSFPADYICEAVDQTRGWFYTLHALSTLLFDRPCYKNVICLGHILDDKGEKMSKSRGNVVEPWAVIQKYGADALRWYLYTASPAGNPRRFSAELVAETVRRFLLTLWNTYSFFVTYANIDRFDPRMAPKGEPASELDRWVLSELNLLISRVEGSLEAYDPTAAARGIETFVDGLSNWYVRRSRRRFWKSENDADKLSAHATLYRCLTTLAHLLAPFTPFLAETMYQNLVRSGDPTAPESVHLAIFPVDEPSQVDEELNQVTRLAMKLSSLGRAARSKAGIKVRQPIAEVHVVLQNKGKDELKATEGRIASWLAEELNAKKVSFTDTSSPIFSDQHRYESSQELDCSVVIDKVLTPELKAEGLAREVVHRLQTMRKEAGFDIADYIVTYFGGDEAVRRVVKQFAGYIQQETLSRQLLEEAPPPGAYGQSHRIDSQEVSLAVRRALRSAPGQA